MSNDQPVDQSLPATNNPASGTLNCGLKGATDNSNIFASVWVKEEDIDNEIQFREEELTDLEPCLEPQKKQRKQYKKRASHLKNLKCDQCDYKTCHKNCLAIHILAHSGTKPFTCSQCDFKTRYPLCLKRHIIVKHNLEATKEELTTYKCNMCSYKTCFKWNLNSHKRKHDLAKQFKCDHCSYCTSYKHNIIKHSRSHRTPEESTYCCDKCPFATKYEGHIARHLAKVHFEVCEKANRCEYCSFSTKTVWRLNIHTKRSRQDSPVKCAYCEYQTIYQCAFKEHKLTHTMHKQNSEQWINSLFTNNPSLNKQNLQNKEEQALEIMKMCEIRSKMEVDAGVSQKQNAKMNDKLKSKLNKNFTYYTLNDNDQIKQILPNYSQSQQSEHEKDNQYIVDPNCEVSWSNIKVKESLNQNRPFQCVTCSYSAKYKASVQRHYQRHHTSHNRPYKCMNCDFSTKTKDQIALHNKRSRSNEILTCKICGLTSAHKCQFLMHEKEHYPFKCVQCSFRCKKKLDMQKHFTVVHLGNGLKCRHCDFQAIRKQSLLVHEAIHTGKKPFHCQLCEYTSVRRSLLENHINRFHKTRVAKTIIDDSKFESLKKRVQGENLVRLEDKN